MSLRVALLLCVTALGILAFQWRRTHIAPGDGSAVWFYDEQSKRLYSTPSDTVPPDNHGVRAIVVAPHTVEPRAEQRKIAYLEMYGPPLKQIYEAERLAHETRRPYQGVIPVRSSEFVMTNTLVRRPNESEWHTVNSEDGRKITSEWRAWTGPNGQPLAVCMP